MTPHFDTLDQIEQATHRAECLALAAGALAETDAEPRYIAAVALMAAEQAKAANEAVAALPEQMRGQ